jgi:hypothetical protein
MLFDGQTFEHLDRGFGGALRLQIRLQDFDVIIELDCLRLSR